jgi:hypothetical protein
METLQALEELQASASRIARIISDLKGFGRATTHAEDTSVLRTLEGALRVTAYEIRSRARLTTDLRETPLVHADATRLSHVFVQILIHVAHSLEAGRATDNEIAVRTDTADSGRVLVSIRGCGYHNSNAQDLLLSPSSQANSGMETGLGLWVSQRIVASLGGTMAIETQPHKGTTVHVTSPEGTDLQMRIDGRSALALDGFSTEPGTFTPFPTGEAAIVPVEGSAEGVVVFDHAIDNVGVLDAPIRCEVRGGRIVRVDGGRSADVFRTLIATDANAGNIAEFAIGTNPKSRLRGNMAEDKVLLGVVHIGVGDSHTIGGLIESQIHVDAIILNPTVEVDGARIVDRRKMLVEVR